MRIKSLILTSICLVIVLIGNCSEIVYRHHSDFDYDLYRSAFLYAVTNGDNYFYQDDQQDLHQYFLNKLIQKSDFTVIHSDSAHHDSTDCRIELVIQSILKTESFNDEGDRKIEMSAEMEVVVYDKNGRVIASREVQEEESRTLDKYTSSDEINAAIYDLSYRTVQNCLNSLSSLFLRDLDI